MSRLKVKSYYLLTVLMASLLLAGCQNSDYEQNSYIDETDFIQDDGEFNNEELAEKSSTCQKASTEQLAQVDLGNTKKSLFLEMCAKETGNSPWCLQLIRPNPNSINIFKCTYGANQVHQLIHPNQNTWDNSFQAVSLVERLEAQGIKICEIYNWWRPEPYNKNVAGAAGRHPFGTSVDVRFCSKSDQERAHAQLCKWRKQGELNALGYYSGTSLHFGIGDNLANTWGKTCPK